MDKHRIVSDAAYYIEGHLADSLTLDDVSGAVYYSKYYLHRVFSEFAGMPLHDYIKRRRLTRAAEMLAYSKRPIVEIAMLSGYASQQSFCKSFRVMYKQSPGAFRKHRRYYPLALPIVAECCCTGSGMQNPLPKVRLAAPLDIPSWMALLSQTVSGFPGLNETHFRSVLQRSMRAGSAFIMERDGTVWGAMILGSKTGEIGFLSVHPCCRGLGVGRRLLHTALEVFSNREIVSVSTFRSGDKADLGQRESLMALGFCESWHTIEYGYPTQRMEFRKRNLGG